MRSKTVIVTIFVIFSIFLPINGFTQALLDDPIFDIPDFPLEEEPLKSPDTNTITDNSTSSESLVTTVSDAGTGSPTSTGVGITLLLSISVIAPIYFFKTRRRYNES